MLTSVHQAATKRSSSTRSASSVFMNTRKKRRLASVSVAPTQLTIANLLAHRKAVWSYDTTSRLNGNYYFNRSFVLFHYPENTHTHGSLWESTTTTSECDA